MCDGTLIFAAELVDMIANGIIAGGVYLNKFVPDNYENEFENYDVIYECGNMTLDTESVELPKDKPYLSTQYIVTLPLKFSVSKRK